MPPAQMAPVQSSVSGAASQIKFQEYKMNEVDLAAFSIERRAVCLTLFRQLHIEDVLLRQLPADEDRAIESVVGFLNHMLEDHPVGHFAFALPAESTSSRNRRILTASINLVRHRGIPLVETPDAELFMAYSHPPLTRREQLRRVGRILWPSLQNLQTTRAAVDAALLVPEE